MTFGRHTFKAGINWRKNDVADFDYGQYTSGLVLEGSLNNFFNGGAAPGGFDLLEQKFLTAAPSRCSCGTWGSTRRMSSASAAI